MEQLWGQLDADHSDTIDFAEFVTWVVRCRPAHSISRAVGVWPQRLGMRTKQFLRDLRDLRAMAELYDGDGALDQPHDVLVCFFPTTHPLNNNANVPPLRGLQVGTTGRFYQGEASKGNGNALNNLGEASQPNFIHRITRNDFLRLNAGRCQGWHICRGSAASKTMQRRCDLPA